MSDLVFGNSLYDDESWNAYNRRMNAFKARYLCKHGLPTYEVCDACGDELAEVCAKVHAEDVASRISEVMGNDEISKVIAGEALA